MSLTAEQAAELASAELTETDTDAVHAEGAPASGEQATSGEATPAEESPAPEGEAADTNEAEGKKDEGEAPEKTPEEQRHWRQVELAKREQIKVARAREELKRDVDRVQQYEQRLTSQFEARTRDLAVRESRVKPLEDALQRRDLSSLQALGFDFAQFARESMEANTPEGIARRTQARVEQLEKERREEAQRRETESRQQAAIHATRRDAQTLVAMVEEAPNECPELYAWAPERVAAEGIAIRDALARQHRAMPTYDQVLAELARRARAEASVMQQRTTTLQQRRSGKPSDAGSAGKADPNRAGKGGNPPALPRRTANERPPVPPREKTEEEIDAECLADLRALNRR